MNSLLIFDHERINDKQFVIKDPRRVDHLTQILRARHGDEIKVCHVNKGLGIAHIHDISKDEVHLELGQTKPGLKPWCHLVMGLSRPPTCKKVLEHGTSMGIGHFHFFNAGLSEKSYMDSKLFQNKKFLDPIYDGLSQSGRYYQTPKVEVNKYMAFNSVEHLPQRFILSPFADESFMDQEIDFDQNIVLAVGPERGWIDDEIYQFKNAGFKEIKISRSILRVEIATFAALGALETLRFSKNFN